MKTLSDHLILNYDNILRFLISRKPTSPNILVFKDFEASAAIHHAGSWNIYPEELGSTHSSNFSEIFLFKIFHLLNLSTCIFLRTGKKATLDLISWWLSIHPEVGNEGQCGETAVNKCVKRSYHPTPLFLTPLLEEAGQNVSLPAAG